MPNPPRPRRSQTGRTITQTQNKHAHSQPSRKMKREAQRRRTPSRQEPSAEQLATDTNAPSIFIDLRPPGPLQARNGIICFRRSAADEVPGVCHLSRSQKERKKVERKKLCCWPATLAPGRAAAAARLSGRGWVYSYRKTDRCFGAGKFIFAGLRREVYGATDIVQNVVIRLLPE